MDIVLDDEPTRLVAQVRRTVPVDQLATFYDSVYSTVVGAVTAAGGTLAGPAVGWYADAPTDTFDVAAGFPVDGLDVGPIGAGVEVVERVGGPSVVAVHHGGYDGLTDAWAEVGAWRAQHAGAVRGDFWEEYVTEPTPDADPADMLTRLVLPLG